MTAPACTFPRCHAPVIGTNRANQPVCREHERVVVSMWVAGRHDESVSDQ